MVTMKEKKIPAILGGKAIFELPRHLVRPIMPEPADIVKDFEDLYLSRMLTNQGHYVKKLEKEIAGLSNAKYCALFCNGTTAIMVLLKALGIKGEVLVPSFTFAATVQAVTWLNLKPVFVDIDITTLNMSPSDIKNKISSDTTLVFPVNIFGRYCNHDEIASIVNEYNIPLIYDSAQAFGSRYNGLSAPLGNAEIYSFHATKIFHTGEGGAVITDDKELYDELCRIRNFGFGEYLNCLGPGINGKMSEFNAVIGLRLLDKFCDHIEQRKQVFEYYKNALVNIEGLELPVIEVEADTNYSYFYVIIDPDAFGLSNIELNYALIAENIISRCYFYPPVHRTTYYQTLQCGKSADLPNTDWASTHILCLPVYSDMQASEIEKIIETILNCKLYAMEIKQSLVGKIPSEWNALYSHELKDPYDMYISETKIK